MRSSGEGRRSAATAVPSVGEGRAGASLRAIPPSPPCIAVDYCQCAPVAQLDRAPGYEPGGREFESLRAHHNFRCLRTLSRLRPFDVVIRTPGRQTSRVRQPGVRAGLDAAARSAAAVRSEAEDERRSREQSLRAHQSSKLLMRFDVGSRWTKWKWALDWSACPGCDL
jgi:hypothetical protein